MTSRLLRLLLWMLSISSVMIFAYVGARRLFYPLELDCIEGVILDHVMRLTAGKPMYVEPTLHFVSLAYMPFFMIVSSWVVRLTGPALWAPRFVSLVSTWGVAILIATVIRRETGGRALALAGAAIYLLGFGYTGSCYDVARPDSLMLLLVLGGLVTLRFTPSAVGALGAAALMTLAFFTKQHALVFGAAAGLHLALNDRRRLLPYAIALVLGCGGGYFLLSRTMGPWFSFYTWDVPSHWSQPSPIRVLHYAGDCLVGTLAVLFIPSLLSLGLPSKVWRGASALWVWAGIGAIGTGLLATLDPAAYRHTLMPTMMAFSILGPLSLHRLARESMMAYASDPRAAMGIVFSVLCLQFLPLYYPIHSRLPHPRAIEAYHAFVADLKDQPGDVLIPYHGFYDWSAGKPSSLHIIPLDDILRARGNRLLRRDPQYFARMFDTLQVGPDRPTLITDMPLDKSDAPWASGPLWKSLVPYYRLTAELGWITVALKPVTGNPYAPAFIYDPVRAGHGALGAASPASRRRVPVRVVGPNAAANAGPPAAAVAVGPADGAPSGTATPTPAATRDAR